MSESYFPTWRDRALCREVDPEIFYPARGGDPRPGKAVCGQCSVRAACLEDALSVPATDDWGIRAGLSANERKQLRRDRLAPVVHLPIPTVPDKDNRRAA